MGGRPSNTYSQQKPRLKYNLNELGVITVVFNPFRYKSRYELYRKFTKHMRHCGIHLFTVECVFANDGDLKLPLQKFEVTFTDEPRHLQIVAPSVIWLKENLINIAVKHLPSSIKYIAWIDADIEFKCLDWPNRAIDALQEFPIVQLYQTAYLLGPSGKKQILHRDYSLVYSIKSKKPLNSNGSSEFSMHPGCAWAMRRETFIEMNGLLEFSPLDLGDTHFAFGLFDRIDETIPANIHEDYRQLVHLWGKRLAQVARHGERVGYIPVEIWHYWHGNHCNRDNMERWTIIQNLQFSPLKDLEKHNKSGLLRLRRSDETQDWSSRKRLEILQRTIINYFRSWDEDNKKNPIPTVSINVLTNAPLISMDDTYITPLHSHASSIQNLHHSDDSLYSTSFSQLPTYIHVKKEVLL